MVKCRSSPLRVFRKFQCERHTRAKSTPFNPPLTTPNADTSLLTSNTTTPTYNPPSTADTDESLVLPTPNADTQTSYTSILTSNTTTPTYNTPSTADTDESHVEDEQIYERNCLSDLSSDDEGEEQDTSAFLKRWTNKFNVQKTALNELLKHLKENGHLPYDSRTLLRTPTQRTVVSIPPGQYVHIGLLKAIDNYMLSCPRADFGMA